MKLILRPNEIELIDSIEVLQAIYTHFSFIDKQVEYQLNRLKAAFNWKEKTPEYYQDLKELESKLIVHCGDRIGTLPIGLLEQVKELCKPTEIDDQRDFDIFISKKLKGDTPTLRWPQAEAIKAALEAKCGLVRMATGVGKTILAQELIRHYSIPSIFLVPSEPILKQTVTRFKNAFGRRLVGTYGGGKKEFNYITVATYQSVYTGNPEDFDTFKLMIGDEIHHIGADTFFYCAQNVLREAVYRYGLTADETRSDGGTILVEAAVGPVIYSYEAPQAIRDGFLAKPLFQIYEITKTKGTYIQWQLDRKTNKRRQIGILESKFYQEQDAHKAYKNWVLGNDLLNDKIAALVHEFKKDGKSILILVDEKEHGDKLIKHFKSDEAEFCYGGREENQDILARFNRRELPIVIGTSTLGEGADTVPVDVLINLLGGTRPKQANGRALRNDVDENGVARKPHCLIIDFDYPYSPVLSRHSQLRCEVHETCGSLYRSELI